MLDDARATCAQSPDERGLDLEPGAVPARVQDARTRMRGFLRKQQLAVLRVERDAPLDQLTDPRRPFLDQHAHRIRMAEPTTGSDGVVEMQLRRIVITDCRGDPALRVTAAPVIERSFGDNGNAGAGCSGQCC